MRRIILSLCVLVAGIAVIGGGIFAYRNLRGIGPALVPAPADILVLAAENKTRLPLKIPEGFSIEIFAKDLAGARVMAFDSRGNLLVSRTGAGIISLLEIRDGKIAGHKDILTGLHKPHGLAFDPDNIGMLYYAEENRISRIDTSSSGAKPEKIVDLPSGGNHFTRTIGFGPDGRLYVSIGSTCNVCRESDARRAAIWSLNRDGSDFKLVAKGLRNSVFFVWHPETEQIWATEMGRDLLGDNTPPDEINLIKEGGNYGWPICYGKNVHDASFDKNTYIRNPCMEPFEIGSAIDIPAHSAPLGLAFVPADAGWPAEYVGNFLVAYHGSWNRSMPTGYKIVRMKPDVALAYQSAEDFVSGWLTPDNRALGRPVDLVFGPDHALYISDDKAGVVYRVVPQAAR